MCRPEVSHVIFDFDGTLSWLRHGWPEIMLNVFLRHAPSAWREEPARKVHLLRAVLSLNGKPSRYQSECFCEELRKNGEKAPGPSILLDEYLAELKKTVDARMASIRDGRCSRDAFVIFNARRILESLRDAGIELILLSGTLERDVRAEAELLQLSNFFKHHIYGSPAEGTFSKKEVIDRVMQEEQLEGRHLLAFGDGPVEIQYTKAVGGLAIGVASDEDHNGSHHMDEAKREHLIAAGADAIIADYHNADALLASILGK